MRTLTPFIVLFSIYIFSSVRAESSLDSDTTKAVQDTQKVLVDPAQREKAVKDSPAAAAAMAQVKQLVGSGQNEQLLYQLSADVFGTLALQANGDQAKMEEILKGAKDNPAAFANTFTPEQLAKLRELASKISGSQVP